MEEPLPEDDKRCRRKGTPNWRCKERALPGRCHCEKHYSYSVSRRLKKKSLLEEERRRISDVANGDSLDSFAVEPYRPVIDFGSEGNLGSTGCEPSFGWEDWIDVGELGFNGGTNDGVVVGGDGYGAGLSRGGGNVLVSEPGFGVGNDGVAVGEVGFNQFLGESGLSQSGANVVISEPGFGISSVENDDFTLTQVGLDVGSKGSSEAQLSSSWIKSGAGCSRGVGIVVDSGNDGIDLGEMGVNYKEMACKEGGIEVGNDFNVLESSNFSEPGASYKEMVYTLGVVDVKNDCNTFIGDGYGVQGSCKPEINEENEGGKVGKIEVNEISLENVFLDEGNASVPLNSGEIEAKCGEVVAGNPGIQGMQAQGKKWKRGRPKGSKNKKKVVDDHQQLRDDENDGKLDKVLINTQALVAQDAAAPNHIDPNNSVVNTRNEIPNGMPPHANSFMTTSKKLQDELEKTGSKMKQHEDNLKFLKAQKNQLDDTILDLQVTLGKYLSSVVPKTEDSVHNDTSQDRSGEETIDQILKHENSAAGIYYQLKRCEGSPLSNLTSCEDALGVVASLGQIDDDNLSRLFSEFLGSQTMLSIVCKTYEGVKALESYDGEGLVNKQSGIHGLGASIGRALEGRFSVICLENLRPYPGEFVFDDQQRRLDIPKPRLPTGDLPAGFLGYAVNMIHIERNHLFYLTSSGYGLRETLFYNLFSRLQVYRTRAEMLLALPCICDGAISLDGGMIRDTGVFSLGIREDVDVRFPKCSMKASLSAKYHDLENQARQKKWEKERLLEDIRREQALLDQQKYNYNLRKQDFLKFLADSSSFMAQQQMQQTAAVQMQQQMQQTAAVQNRQVPR